MQAATPVSPIPPQAPVTVLRHAADPPLHDTAFRRVRTQKPLVALTFDCCQTARPAGYDARIVKFLVSGEVPATFLLGGRWMEAHPEQTRYLASVPFFELGNHSYLHPHMPLLTRERMSEELGRTQEIQRELTGKCGRVFRPPFGEWSDDLVAAARDNGLCTVTWDIETGDPDRHATVEDLQRAVRKARPGSIITMHANGRGWRTAEALPGILRILSARGLKPVTVSALLNAGTAEPETTMKR